MRKLRRDGVALAYEEAGSGAPPVVLVHDLGSDHTCFAAQFEHLRHHHRVVAADLRGHGQSDKPGQAYAVALLADDLAWLCYELGLYRPALLGLGLGGLVALELAARYPDLPAGVVALAPAVASPAPLIPVPELEADSCPDNRSTGDRAAAPGYVVPKLRVASRVGEASLPEETYGLVDEFLAKLAGRAPPDHVID